LFLTGQTLALFGTSVVGYAVIWYITLKTGSGTQYALMFVASSLAGAITTLPGGIWADRYSRKALMIGADLLVAFLTVILAVAMLSGYEQLWLIITLLCLRGLAGGVRAPAVLATIPQLVPQARLLRVNSINASLQSLIFIAAPALAAVLLVYFKLGWILMFDVVTAIIGVICILMVTIPKLIVDSTPEGLKGYVSHMAEAGRYVLTIPGLRRLGLIYIFILAIVLPPAQMTPVLVVRLFGNEQWKLALVEILWSVGMVIGGLILAAWGGLKNRMTLIMIVAALWATFTIGLGLSPNLLVFSVFMVVYGLTVPGFDSAAITSCQELIPSHLLGRTMALVRFIASLAVPIGMGIMGPLADVINIRIVTVICGTLGLIFIAILSRDRGPSSQLFAPENPTP